MTTHETRKVAQIAVEAIVNDPTAYDADTIALVRKVGTELGVSRLYMDMLPTLRDCCRCCYAAVERGEDIGHQPGPDSCPHPRCDYCQGEL